MRLISLIGSNTERGGSRLMSVAAFSGAALVNISWRPDAAGPPGAGPAGFDALPLLVSELRSLDRKVLGPGCE